MTDIIRIAGGHTDEEWFQVILGSLSERNYKDITLPGFPNETIQKSFVGTFNEGTIREGFNFYIAVRDYCNKHKKLKPESKVLDFGCGWGRMIRFFLRECLAENIYGVDVDENIIDLCKNIMGYGNYETIDPFPPMRFENDSFDLIYAYSVFSHLSQEAATKWVHEFSRILKPGGLLIATTQGRSFIDFCESCRPKLSIIQNIMQPLGLHKPSYESHWHKSLAHSFIDTAKAKSDYDEGEFLFSPTGGGDFRPSSFYGEALIPKKFVEENWTTDMTLLDFIDDRNFLPQAVMVMQK